MKEPPWPFSLVRLSCRCLLLVGVLFPGRVGAAEVGTGTATQTLPSVTTVRVILPADEPEKNLGFTTAGVARVLPETDVKLELIGTDLLSIRSVHYSQLSEDAAAPVDAEKNTDTGVTVSVVKAAASKNANDECSENATLVSRRVDFNREVFTDTKLRFRASFPESERSYHLCIMYGGNGADEETPVLHSHRYQLPETRILSTRPPKKTYFPVPVQILILCCLLVLSGLFSGLNLGLMALDVTSLEVIINSGTKQERHYAETILPVRRTGNYLLCSLLLGNVIVNSGISILFDDLTSGIVALIVSSFGIVVFGEILPQSICVKKGLAVGAYTIMITRFFMVLTAPLSWPIGKLLDCLLGAEAREVYSKERLMELIKMSINDSVPETAEEFRVVTGAMEYSTKTVKDIMTKIEDVFMLSGDSVLNVKMVADVIQSGYTRIPVYESGDINNVVALLNVKDLALLDPDDNLTVKTVCTYWSHPLRFVMEDAPLKVMLDEFKKGHYHLAMVQTVIEPEEGDNYYQLTGIVTLEDIIEEIIQAEIVDETDVITDNVQKKRRGQAQQLQSLSSIIEKESTSNVMVSHQLQLAAMQFLTVNFPAFHAQMIANGVLQRLIRNKNHVKCVKVGGTSVSRELYTKGKMSDKFVLILEGRVHVTVGQSELKFEAGPFHSFGSEVLTKMSESILQMGGNLLAPAINARTLSISRRSLPGSELTSVNQQSGGIPVGGHHSFAETRGGSVIGKAGAGAALHPKAGSFLPDFTATISEDVTYIEISAAVYMNAYKMTQLERGKNIDRLPPMQSTSESCSPMEERAEEQRIMAAAAADVGPRTLSAALAAHRYNRDRRGTVPAPPTAAGHTPRSDDSVGVTGSDNRRSMEMQVEEGDEEGSPDVGRFERDTVSRATIGSPKKLSKRYALETVEEAPTEAQKLLDGIHSLAARELSSQSPLRTAAISDPVQRQPTTDIATTAEVPSNTRMQKETSPNELLVRTATAPGLSYEAATNV